MRLTPLDIRHKEFRTSLRGYHEDEVDVFLDEVADEFERLFKENIDQSEKLENVNERIRSYQDIEQTLQNTLVTAQRSADDIMTQARKEAELIKRDAELKAKEIIQSALGEKQKVNAELMRIKRAEGEFRAQFRAKLEEYLTGMQEIPLPADVAGIDLTAGVLPAAAPVAAAAFAVETGAVDDVEAGIPSTVGIAAAPDDESWSAQDALVRESDSVAFEPFEPPAEATDDEQTSSVRGVMLGEVGETDLSAVEPVLTEPAEFTMPSFDSFGEADEDIEEID